MKFFDALRRRPTALFGLVLVLMVAGTFAAMRLPSAIFPSVTFPIVKVIADAGEEPAARMMPTVTRPLEEAGGVHEHIELIRAGKLRNLFQCGTDDIKLADGKVLPSIGTLRAGDQAVAAGRRHLQSDDAPLGAGRDPEGDHRRLHHRPPNRPPSTRSARRNSSSSRSSPARPPTSAPPSSRPTPPSCSTSITTRSAAR